MISHRPARSELEQINIDLIGIGELLSRQFLIVPPYQRDYAWKQEQVEELLTDLSDAISNQAIEYFLGTVVISTSTDDIGEVTDGQQRLATITIVLASIRDYFLSIEDIERAEMIEHAFLQEKDRRTLEVRPRLTLNERDHQYFLDRVLSRKKSNNGTSRNKRVDPQQMPSPSNARLAAAAAYAADFVRNLVTIHGREPTKHLLDWVDFIEKRAKVIWVQVPDSANAFTIFETLNDRGLDLAVSDLLKNYLLSKVSSDRLEDVKSQWIDLVSVLESASPEEEIVVGFVRHYWSSHYGLTRERELFRQVKQRVTSSKYATELVADLRRASRVYSALLNPAHELWRKFGSTAAHSIQTLNLLRMTQLRPLLLAILDQFKTQEVRNALRFLVACAVRVLIVGSRSGTLEEAYSSVAKRVRAGELSDAPQLRRAMQDVFPSDIEFREKFAVATVSKDYLARYYLAVLESTAKNESAPELVVNPNSEQVNLEHVLPENPEENWQDVPVDLHRALVKRIGNLALLGAKENAAAGNAPFSKKKASFKKSRFMLTKMISKAKEWGPAAISERQDYLADLAVKAWSSKFA